MEYDHTEIVNILLTDKPRIEKSHSDPEQLVIHKDADGVIGILSNMIASTMFFS